LQHPQRSTPAAATHLRMTTLLLLLLLSTPAQPRGYVLVDAGGRVVAASAAEEVRAAEAERGQVPGEALWLRRGELGVLVTRPEALAAARADLAAVAAARDEEHRLAAEAGRLGRREAEQGGREAAVARDRAELAARRSSFDLRRRGLRAETFPPSRISPSAFEPALRQLVNAVTNLHIDEQRLALDARALLAHGAALAEARQRLDSDRTALGHRRGEARARAATAAARLDVDLDRLFYEERSAAPAAPPQQP
jgi:hypothetical protein